MDLSVISNKKKCSKTKMGHNHISLIDFHITFTSLHTHRILILTLFNYLYGMLKKIQQPS